MKKYPSIKRNVCGNKYFGGYFCVGSDLPVKNQSKNIECTKQMSSGDSKMSRDSWLEEQQQQKHIIVPALAPKKSWTCCQGRKLCM